MHNLVKIIALDFYNWEINEKISKRRKRRRGSEIKV